MALELEDVLAEYGQTNTVIGLWWNGVTVYLQTSPDWIRHSDIRIVTGHECEARHNEQHMAQNIVLLLTDLTISCSGYSAIVVRFALEFCPKHWFC